MLREHVSRVWLKLSRSCLTYDPGAGSTDLLKSLSLLFMQLDMLRLLWIHFRSSSSQNCSSGVVFQSMSLRRGSTCRRWSSYQRYLPAMQFLWVAAYISVWFV